jgi:hypothetical protein
VDGAKSRGELGQSSTVDPALFLAFDEQHAGKDKATVSGVKSARVRSRQSRDAVASIALR